MLTRVSSFLLLAAAALPALAEADSAAQAEAVNSVVVPGQRPGPGLWKVSKDGHDMWILGTYGPLLKDMHWRSAQAEKMLLQSQEVLAAPSSGFSVSITGPLSALKAMTMLPSIIGIQNNPDGAKLQDVLPPELYARWLPLKKKYLGDDNGIERERPFFAADHLFNAALDKSGLSKNDVVWGSVNALAKKNKIKVSYTGFSVELDNPRAAIKDFRKASLPDQECFAKTLARLETDVDAIRVRATAWAIGDLAAMEKLSYSDNVASCYNALLASEALKAQPGMANLEQRAREKWLAAAEKALTLNQSTFALMPIEKLLDPNGYLAALQAKGYQVERPD